jgi:hypothetical protein
MVEIVDCLLIMDVFISLNAVTNAVSSYRKFLTLFKDFIHNRSKEAKRKIKFLKNIAHYDFRCSTNVIPLASSLIRTQFI